MHFSEKIRFNEPPRGTNSLAYMAEAVRNNHISGDGEFTRRANAWLEEATGAGKCMLTTSCTHALEMSAFLCHIAPGDEVIMPSYTFTSTANAFALRGAKIVFVDIRPDTMNIDESLIEEAITEKTKAIVAVHYAGVACEMDQIMELAGRHGLYVVEDAAQAIMSTYRGKPVGAIGNFGCLSFHETKNFTMGEGGALLLRDAERLGDAEILREKGTDRGRYFRGQVDKYTWQDCGSSYLPSELNAAFLVAQLEEAEIIQKRRMEIWEEYNQLLAPLRDAGHIELPTVPAHLTHNAHMYYIKCADLAERSALIKFLSAQGILAVFHYIPLHSAPAALRYARFCGRDTHTTKESERLLRLPLHLGLESETVEYISLQVKKFYA